MSISYDFTYSFNLYCLDMIGGALDIPLGLFLRLLINGIKQMGMFFHVIKLFVWKLSVLLS